jgi:hypothetical protein
MKYQKPVFEVGNIIRQYRAILEAKGKLNSQQKKVFTNLQQCRTAALGYHKDKCDNPKCQHEHISYNSCRDRHCPKCNGLRREKWIRMREDELMPVKYFHVVFTLPDSLNPLFLEKPTLMYNLLFTCAWQTIKQFARDHKHLGADTGMIAILHSWGQNLSLHPHIHCLVPGGGITRNKKWRSTRNKGKFLFPVKAMAKVFRGKFSDALIAYHEEKSIHLDVPFDKQKKYIHPLYKKKWVVYAKLPMHNARQVINYIGRYSHRIAISNHRVKDVQNNRVKFSWFNYRTSKTGMINLHASEFLQRFSLHILPPGFMKIRHYGILSARSKKESLACVRSCMESQETTGEEDCHTTIYSTTESSSINVRTCPVCRKGMMQLIAVIKPPPRGSPFYKFPKTDFFKAS